MRPAAAPGDVRLVPPRRPAGAAQPLVAAAGMRIGLFGGSFNPAHEGHAAIGAEALKRLALDRVWWLVSPHNPLKTDAEMAPLEERLARARRFACDPRMRISDIEDRLGLVYSVDTVAALRTRWPATRFVWLAGADVLAEFHRWRSWQRLAASLPLAFFDRPGFGLSALSAPFARRFARARVDETDAALLPRLAAPAWSLIHVPLRPESATRIRRQRGY